MPEILLAFDSDEAGQQAALDAIERHWQTFFDDPELDNYHNPSWVKEGELYQQFLHDLMTSVFTYQRRAQDKIDPKQCRRWPAPRLLYVLNCWQHVIYKIVGFGNSFLLEWALPIARECEGLIIKELSRRATPKKNIPEPHILESLRADQVIKKVSCQSVFEHYLTKKMRMAGDELYSICPFCDGSRENWSANVRTGLYRCKAKCGRAGSVFQFVMDIEKISFPVAVKRVAELGGM